MTREYSRKVIADLRNRWQGQKERLQAIVSDAVAGRDWTVNLSTKSRWGELPQIASCPSQFRIPGEAGPRDLRGVHLDDVNLSGLEGFANTCMDASTFNKVVLEGASLRGVSLRHAQIGEGCILNRAILQFADLRNANCKYTQLVEADLTRSDLRGSDLRGAILIRTTLKDVKYNQEMALDFLWPWRWRKLRRWTRFGGNFQSPNQMHAVTDQLLVNFINGENLKWITERNHPILAKVWYILADYGRSPKRLLVWAMSTWLLFGLIYAGYPLPRFLEDTWLGDVLCRLSPEIDYKIPDAYKTFTPYYFSTVVMTTLGFGDVVPSVNDWKAQVYVCLEVVLGYLFMAILVSLLLQNGINLLTYQQQDQNEKTDSS